ncbi:myeloid-associated differentiation marker homolog [Alosa pseudoharengus]|uniref:myeloid-associated differentiation marker homolog n=1 Tax=Alosa pseudoharengus TaxID=34774 RepID=UPI003F8CDB08
MAQTQVVLNIQDFYCPICLELLEDPTTIPCGHSYCQSCLQEYWVGNNDSETVICPQCRESFTPMPLLGKNILLAETVDRLRITCCSTSPAIAASANTATNVRQQRAPVSTATNVRQQRASVSTATNVQQQCTSASTATNVRPQRASASTATSVRQQRAPVSTATNARPQRASAFPAANVQSQHAPAFSAISVQWPRVLAMLFACVAFSVAIKGARVHYYGLGILCIFLWGFSSIGTLLVLLVELCTHRFWKNFPITYACFASLLCLSASITFALHFVKDVFMHGVSYNYRVVSLVFSCFATIAYVMEVIIRKVRANTDREAGYMTTVPGLLKVCETFVAGIIFVFISDPNAYKSHAAIKWCMAVYCICFILSSMFIILCFRNGSDFLSPTPTCCLSFYALLAVIMYLTATIIWPIYKFDKLHGGSPSRPSQCSSSNPDLCPFDKLIVVAVLTGVNFILYLADLIFSLRRCLCQIDSWDLPT